MAKIFTKNQKTSPKEASVFIISRKERLTVSLRSLLIMEHLSQTISFNLWANEAIEDHGDMSHMVIVVTSNGILNVEREVRLPLSSKAAVMLDATAMAIFPDWRTQLRSALNTNVLSVPLGPPIKKIRESCELAWKRHHE